MTNNEIIKQIEICINTPSCVGCPYIPSFGCKRYLLADALSLLKKQEAKLPIHVHEEYPEHDWETDEKGEIDDCAWGQEYCNGPMCKRCYYSFCINCEPNGWNKKPCIVDFFKCPNCGERIFKHGKNIEYCVNCGQAVQWY